MSSGRLVTSTRGGGSQRTGSLSGTLKAKAALPRTAKTLLQDKPETLSYENQELLKRLLITISKGERSIERQRQVLASLRRFEPHSAFQRIDRDQDSKITSLEILKFLRDNGVEEATEADTCYIVKYFDSNDDEKLEYEDLMQMVMPCDDQYLRAAIAQRDIYEVTKHDFLDAEIEAELTRLFEKEIALNRVTEELKQEMDATKSFCVKKAFDVIDDWKYGYIDKKNLKSFLRKHNYLASTAECMAIIRRLDLDADARLSRHEFADGLRPEEPYSRALKRTQMRRGTSSNAQRAPRNGISAKSGQILMLKASQHNNVRTLAMDRQQNRKGLRNGTTPMKSRPTVTADLSLFSSPRSQGRSKPTNGRRLTHRQPKQLNQSHMMEPIPSARSNKSRKSSKSLTKSIRSSTMQRHASALVGGRRKKDQKPRKQKKMKRSQSRKSLKRQGSMDDVLIDRLSKPVDHSKLRKKIEMEQKLEFMRSKPGFQRSRSRSAKKHKHNLEDGVLVKKYKTFVRKMKRDRDSDHDESNWRGANDFTRLSFNQHASNEKQSLDQSGERSFGMLNYQRFYGVPRY